MEVLKDLKNAGFRPKKSFGQNFLCDPNICRSIAALASTAGTALEIGAGAGSLTSPLLTQATHVIALERDRELVPLLHKTFANEVAHRRLIIHEADALDRDWKAELAGMPPPYVLVGNLPYSITGALLQRAVSLASYVDRAVFMIQREVADRLTAKPSTKAYGALSVFVQAAFDVHRAFHVHPGAFWPQPAVDSTVVVLMPHRPARAEETPAFREAIQRAFAQRRKTLRNAWRGLYGWSPEELQAKAGRIGIDLNARGETLPVEAFAALATQALTP